MFRVIAFSLERRDRNCVGGEQRNIVQVNAAGEDRAAVEHGAEQRAALPVELDPASAPRRDDRIEPAGEHPQVTRAASG